MSSACHPTNRQSVKISHEHEKYQWQVLGFQEEVASALMLLAQAATKNIALRKLAALLYENTQVLQVDNAKETERAIPNGLSVV